MTAASDSMENRMRGVLHRTFEVVMRADRVERFLNRDERGRPSWTSLRRFLLGALHRSGGDEEAANQFEKLPPDEQDRLLRYYERASQP